MYMYTCTCVHVYMYICTCMCSRIFGKHQMLCFDKRTTLLHNYLKGLKIVCTCTFNVYFVSHPTCSLSSGCVSPMDVSSLSSNGQLLLFSGGPISYGLLSEVSVFSRDFTWLGDRRIDIAQLRAVLYNRWVW